MNRPLIGVLPLWDGKNGCCWMRPGYMDGLLRAGALPVMLPLDAEEDLLRTACRRCDGFLFTGGPDLSPALYRETPRPETGPASLARDALELLLIRLALAEDLPVLGICRGLQLLNVALGGTLYQDLPSQYPGRLQHKITDFQPAPTHLITPIVGSPLAALLGIDPQRVNTRHHQGIRELAPSLRPMAVAEDGLIEGVWKPEQRFVWAVQWHPELMLDEPSSEALFRRFVEACR